MLLSETLKVNFRTEDKYFTRKRQLSLADIAVLVIRGQKMPMQNAINKFFREEDKKGRKDHIRPVTASAYSQARQKFKGELFLELNRAVHQIFYREDNQENLRLWKGKRLLGIDTFIMNVPDTVEMRKKYSLHKNRYSERLQAQASVLYDLLNDVAISALIDKKKAEKQYIFEDHDKYIKEDSSDIVIMDMGYLDYSLMAQFSKENKLFVIRVPLSGKFNKVADFAENPKAYDRIVRLGVSQRQMKFIEDNNLPKEIKVRLIKLKLSKSLTEILITNIFDKSLGLDDFKELYGKRWNEETYFDRLKNLFEIEKFSGITDLTIKQDFYGIIFLSTIESILVRPSDKILKEKSLNNKYQYQVNRSLSISTMLDFTVDLLINTEKTVEEVINELSEFLVMNPCLKRLNRNYERHKGTTATSLHHHKYRKKVIA